MEDVKVGNKSRGEGYKSHISNRFGTGPPFKKTERVVVSGD